MRCFQELLQYGAQEYLERVYGPYITEPENGYDFSVVVDLDNLPAEKGWISNACLRVPVEQSLF